MSLWFEGTAHHGGKGRVVREREWLCEVAGHTASADKKQRKMKVGSPLMVSF